MTRKRVYWQFKASIIAVIAAACTAFTNPLIDKLSGGEFNFIDYLNFSFWPSGNTDLIANKASIYGTLVIAVIFLAAGVIRGTGGAKAGEPRKQQ